VKSRWKSSEEVAERQHDEEDDHDLVHDPRVRAHPVTGLRKEGATPLTEGEQRQGGEREEEERQADEGKRVPPGVVVSREVGANRNRGEDVGREDPEQQETEAEGPR
jgi:hypothetical protein